MFFKLSKIWKWDEQQPGVATPFPNFERWNFGKFGKLSIYFMRSNTVVLESICTIAATCLPYTYLQYVSLELFYDVAI